MVNFSSNAAVPSLGLGTWRMGESRSRRRAEIGAVRLALETGWRVIDTAEMYGDGGAEEVVGAAIAEALRAGVVRRDELFVVSKVLPQHATARGTVQACEQSLARLGLDRLDAYLLHWRGQVPLEETVGAFERLHAGGKIRCWGVSNFDVDDMEELLRVPGGERCATNQIYYSLTARGPQFDLVPWLQARQIATMAYSPIDQGALARNAALRRLAERLGRSPAQLALAWLIAQEGVMAIPKASTEAHLRDNFAASTLVLDDETRRELDRMFPPPTRKSPLVML